MQKLVTDQDVENVVISYSAGVIEPRGGINCGALILPAFFKVHTEYVTWVFGHDS